jgi:hypothetical protein
MLLNDNEDSVNGKVQVVRARKYNYHFKLVLNSGVSNDFIIFHFKNPVFAVPNLSMKDCENFKKITVFLVNLTKTLTDFYKAKISAASEDLDELLLIVEQASGNFTYILKNLNNPFLVTEIQKLEKNCNELIQLVYSNFNRESLVGVFLEPIFRQIDHLLFCSQLFGKYFGSLASFQDLVDDLFSKGFTATAYFLRHTVIDID